MIFRNGKSAAGFFCASNGQEAALKRNFLLTVLLAVAGGCALGFFVARAVYQSETLTHKAAVPLRKAKPDRSRWLKDPNIVFTITVDLDLDKKKAEKFPDDVERLIGVFKEFDVLKGVTWYVNEYAYPMTRDYPETLKKIVMTGGEIGLHTHLNDASLGGHTYFCSRDADKFARPGIFEPKKALENFTSEVLGKPYQLLSFKGGNHCRSTMLYKALIDAGFIYETTMVFGGIWRKEVDGAMTVVYDDLDLRMGRGPWFVDLQHPYQEDPEGKLLEIPETGYPNVEQWIKHIRTIRKTEKDMPIFFVMQIHPYSIVGVKEAVAYEKRLRDSIDPFPNRRFLSVREAGALYKEWLAKKRAGGK